MNPARSGAVSPAILQGHSETALQLQRQVSAAAASADPVLILAEPGLDAAQVAAVLHEGRAGQRLHALDCGALSTDILTSRLFGRPELPPRKRRDLDVVTKRAALLGAGTVFLANITEMGAALQRRLARVLRDGEVYVDDRPQPVPVLARLVASAVPDVLDDVDASRFWSGLYRRFASSQIELVPLRARAADIPEIVLALSEELAARKGVAPRAFTPAAMTALGSLAWPGNLDELRELLERLHGDDDSGAARQEDVLRALGLGRARPIAGGARFDSLRRARQRFEREYIAAVLDRHGWRMAEAAATLGMERANLYRKIRQLGLPRPQNGNSGEH